MESSVFRATVYLANDKGQVSVESGDRREIEKLVRDFAGINIADTSDLQESKVDLGGLIDIPLDGPIHKRLIISPNKMELVRSGSDEWENLVITLSERVSRDSVGHVKGSGISVSISIPKRGPREPIIDFLDPKSKYTLIIDKLKE